MNLILKAFNWHARSACVAATVFFSAGLMADGPIVLLLFLASTLMLFAGFMASLHALCTPSEGMTFPAIDPEMIPVKERS